MKAHASGGRFDVLASPSTTAVRSALVDLPLGMVVKRRPQRLPGPNGPPRPAGAFGRLAPHRHDLLLLRELPLPSRAPRPDPGQTDGS